jgi:hypothetical protein
VGVAGALGGAAGPAEFTVTVAVCVTVFPAESVTARVYVVVLCGDMFTGVPLAAVILPGVITPVPLANTPVKLDDPPAVIADGFAVKEVIVGVVEAAPLMVPLPQPKRPAKHRMGKKDKKANARMSFIMAPVSEATR